MPLEFKLQGARLLFEAPAGNTLIFREAIIARSVRTEPQLFVGDDRTVRRTQLDLSPALSEPSRVGAPRLDEPEGIPVLIGHDAERPAVGRVLDIYAAKDPRSENGMLLRADLQIQATSPDGQTAQVLQNLKNGNNMGLSMGLAMDGLEVEREAIDDDLDVLFYRRFKIQEVSLTAMPAIPGAALMGSGDPAKNLATEENADVST